MTLLIKEGVVDFACVFPLQSSLAPQRNEGAECLSQHGPGVRGPWTTEMREDAPVPLTSASCRSCFDVDFVRVDVQLYPHK